MSDNTMQVVLNDKALSVTDGITVDALLQQLEVRDAQGIAVAVNDTVVRRGDWPSHALSDQDRILLIAPIQGG